MSRLQQFLMSLVVLCGAIAAPALAASSASSASSDGSSASVGSLSTSIEKSSKSSSKDDKVAAGDYRIVAAAETAAGTVRLTLQALNAADGEFDLIVPPETVQQAGLATGGVVTARHQAYGLEFSAGAPRQAFFLALRDEWYQELQTRVIKL